MEDRSSYAVRTLVSPGFEAEDCVIETTEGSITGIIPGRKKAHGYDACYAIPGFVDIHTNGGMGHDVTDATE